MGAIEMYREALKYHLESRKIKQADLAAAIGQTPQQLNGFLRGRRNYSETKKEEIAEKLGTTYLDMLNLGRQLLRTSQPPLKPETDPPGEPCAKVIDMMDLPHEKIIERFSDKCTAKEINLMLVELERNEPELFKQARTYILALYDVLKIKKTANDDD